MLAATALAPYCASAQGPAEDVQSIDIYGSSVFDSAAIRAEFSPDILRYVELLGMQLSANETPVAPEKAAELRAGMQAIETKIRTALESRTPLAFFEIHPTTDQSRQVNVTVDVVEKTDEARRMPFRDAPTADLGDPGGTLALWRAYEQKFFELVMAGAPSRVNANECPVLHCMVSFDSPELAPYLERLNEGARLHEDALYTVTANSAGASQRATALFVLAHTNDAKRLTPVLGRAIYDPDPGVRNNAMRVLAFMAAKGVEADYPIRDLIVALDFPSSTDRNKAASALSFLAPQPAYRDAIRRDAVPVLLRLLRLEQPNNHTPAHQILKAVSGETFGDRDYAAWERWAASRTLR
jgi:hypothetical protein